MKGNIARFTVLAGVCGVLSGLPSSLLAETEKIASKEVRSFSNVGWKFGAYLSRVNIDADVASTEAVDESANSLGFTGQYFFRPEAYVSFGIEAMILDDDNTFSQVVENTFTGDTEVLESTAMTIPLELEAGYSLSFDAGKPVMLALNSGYTQVLASGREIANCADCDEEDIDIDGGLYAGVLLGLNFNPVWSAQLRFRNYLSGDFENSLGIGVHWSR